MRRAAISLLLAVVVVVVVGLLWAPGPTNTSSATADATNAGDRLDGDGSAEDLAQGMLNLDESSPGDAVPPPQSVAPAAGQFAAPALPAISGTFDDAIPAPSIGDAIVGAASGSGAPNANGLGGSDMRSSSSGSREANLQRYGGTMRSGGGFRSSSGEGKASGGSALQGQAFGGSGALGGRGAAAGRPARAAEPKPAEPKPDVATWKRSQLVPNTSRLMVGDKEELPLKGLQVDARIDGFRARVVLDCFYYNDQRRALEGSFQLRLPNGASPYYFAFGAAAQPNPYSPSLIQTYFISTAALHRAGTSPKQLLALRSGTSWELPREARVVPKEKAAFAYTETVRQKVDPALVEWAGAGVFQSRVFPLQPGKLHRIVVGYDVDLLPVDDELEFRLELPQIKIPCVADVNVASPSGTTVKIETAAEFQRSDDGRANFRFDNWNGREIVLRTTPPGPVVLTGSDPRTGPYFATRVRPTLPPATSAAGLPRGVFLVDTSLSASPEQFNVWLKLLRAILDNNRASLREFAVLFFNVEAHWWQEKFVANTPANVAELLTYANTLSLEGATDLGQALADAAAPAWLGKEYAAGDRHDVFLLSDAAANWGQSDPAALAKILKSGSAGPLLAYATGLAGSDTQLLALLARESGGAVFSVVGDAEVAAASIAHRTRPWQLVGVAIDGGSDLLVAGRPRTVFPGQNLLIVGRGKPSAATSEVTLTLRQGDEQQVVKTRLAAEIASELAPRAYGQAAVDQLEELPGDLGNRGVAKSDTAGSGATGSDIVPGDTAQIATAYARHFRVTGRTCSLVMLESEDDYRRFGIKPELDELVVKTQQADGIIALSDELRATAAADGKAAFLAWLQKMEKTPGAKFEAPLALRLALAKMPAAAFEVRAPRLVCKGRTPQGQPSAFQEQLAAREADYDLIAAESQRRLKELGPHDALRALSSLIEQSPGDVVLVRDVAFSAMEWQLAGHAYYLLRRVAVSRPFEPQTYHALARCLEELGNTDLALAYYEVCLAGQWDERHPDFKQIVTFDYLRLLRAIGSGQQKTAAADYAAAQLRALNQPACDLVVIIGWNTDRSDVDLHVSEPGGEVCCYNHTRTALGGRITRDVTQGYGPEMYILRQAAGGENHAGEYHVHVRYFASDANRASARTKVHATIYQGWGTPQERVLRRTVTLETGRTEHLVAAVKVE